MVICNLGLLTVLLVGLFLTVFTKDLQQAKDDHLFPDWESTHDCGTWVSSKWSIPVYDVTNCQTNYALGYSLGYRFRTVIQQRFSKSIELEKMMDYYGTDIGKQTVQVFMELHKSTFPSYYAELLGTSVGADVPLEQVFMMNIRQELGIIMRKANFSGSSFEVEDCSDVLLHYNTQVLLGHNEDERMDLLNATYVVVAHTGGVGWTAYTYAGELPTTAFGFNSAGIGFTLNAVFPNRTPPSGIARNFLSRSLLEAQDLEDAVDKITAQGQMVGHSYNLMDFHTQTVWNAEVGPEGVHNIIKVNNGSYFHANIYQHLNVSQDINDSSVHRIETARRYQPVLNAVSAMELLGDDSDPQFQIYRTGIDGLYTLCTALFDLKAGVLRVYEGNPREGKIALQLSLNSKTAVTGDGGAAEDVLNLL